MNRRRLVWVRHALATSDPATPAHAWPLTREGREAALRLAPALAGLPPPLSVVTSSECKAVETADALCEALGLGLAGVSPDLREVQRPWTDGDYRAAARAYLRSGSAPGWEPRDQVLRRLSRALAEHWGPDGTTITVSHGLAMSIWAADASDGIDSVEFWDTLTFPDAWLVDEDRRTLCRLAG
ncbi:MAG: histidine phosphatase family protein [Chloroflexi bacterium]|nr:histidine phosphatase family protein [Chloroflexota bacterium]